MEDLDESRQCRTPRVVRRETESFLRRRVRPTSRVERERRSGRRRREESSSGNVLVEGYVEGIWHPGGLAEEGEDERFLKWMQYRRRGRSPLYLITLAHTTDNEILWTDQTRPRAIHS
jgi:hypothetical protein